MTLLGSNNIGVTTIATIPPAQPLATDALHIQIFGNETIGSFIQESVEGIRRVEKETYELFDKIRDDILVKAKDKDNPMRIEDVILVAPIAKDYLTLLSQQADSRTKILKSITDLFKAQQPGPAYQTNIMGANSGGLTPEQMQIQSILEQHEQQESKQLKAPKFEEEDEKENTDIQLASESQSSSKPINVIHSYGYKKP